jgi:hypothetical protein
VEGRWESNEEPNKNKYDHQVATISDAICKCIGERIKNPGAPPKYCSVPPITPAPDGKSRWTCENCQTWVNRQVEECSKPKKP